MITAYPGPQTGLLFLRALRYTAAMRRLMFLFAALLLSACGSEAPAPLPQGAQTATGTLVAVELSLVRRGTHHLVVRGAPLYFLESTSLNLHQFEGQTVGVTGTLSPNVGPEDLPVMNVTAVQAAKRPEGTAVHLPTVGLRLTVPPAWIRRDDAAAVIFTSSGGQTLLRVAPSPLIALPEDGVLSLIGGQRAAKVVRADGTEEFTVQSGARFVRIELPPFSTAEFGLIDERQAVLQSAVFPQSASSASASSQGAPSAFCGGRAGVLCPSGSVCIITDPVESVGYCAAVGKPKGG